MNSEERKESANADHDRCQSSPEEHFQTQYWPMERIVLYVRESFAERPVRTLEAFAEYHLGPQIGKRQFLLIEAPGSN
jgi:hypothetical protein